VTEHWYIPGKTFRFFIKNLGKNVEIISDYHFWQTECV